MPAQCDGEFVQRARHGDEHAFAKLVGRHYRRVSSIAYAITGDWAAAEDLAQETFLVAWQNLKRIRDPERFHAWLCTIARNLSRNWRRSRQCRLRLSEHRQELENAASKGPNVMESLAKGEKRAELEHALESVSAPVREVVVLFYLEELSVQETAEALGLTQSAVKKRLQRGRESLKGALEKQWRQDMQAERRTVQTADPVKRVLMGLATGPAIPELGRAASGSLLDALVYKTVQASGLKSLQTAGKGWILMSSRSIPK